MCSVALLAHPALHLKVHLILPGRFIGALEMVVDAQTSRARRNIVLEPAHHRTLGRGGLVTQGRAGADLHLFIGMRGDVTGEADG